MRVRPKNITVIVHEDSVVVTFPENSAYDDNEQLLIQRHHKRVQEQSVILDTWVIVKE